MRRALAIAAALATGCHSLLGLDEFATDEVKRGITGTSITTYHSELAEVAVPDDLTAVEITVYLPDPADAGGLAIYPGSGTADGRFAVPDVPLGEYYLRVKHPDRPELIYQLSERTLDLGGARVGNPERAPALQLASPIALTIANMQRYVSRDTLSVYTSAYGVEQFPELIDREPQLGATELAGATFDATGLPPLRDDGLWVIHHTSWISPRYDEQVTWTSESAYLPALTQTEGVALPVTGAFVPGGPREATIAVDIDAIRRAMPGDRSLDSSFGLVFATPDRDAGTLSGPTVMTYHYAAPLVHPVALHRVRYSDPFPAAWSRVAQAGFRRARRALRMPGGGGTLLLLDSLAEQRVGTEPAPFGGGPIAQPPGNLRLDGAALSDRVRLPGGPPIALAWDPVDGATHYSVTITTLEIVDGATRRTVVATVLASRSELVLPTDVLRDHTRFTFRITAIAGGELGAAPHRTPIDRSTSATTSDIVYVSSLCGNGVIDTGEACDTRGPSAGCDLDCSAPLCGDGVLNLAAGEQCDFSMFIPTQGCDACRLVSCGDGVVAGVERCDDGNTAPGDGCDADCQFEPSTRCGNAMTDPGEECDDGNTSNLDACTTSCQYAVCGDGLRTSNEECDDGNHSTGDGCTEYCELDRCGDGFRVLPEECDDGNTANGDACSSTCKVTTPTP